MATDKLSHPSGPHSSQGGRVGAPGMKKSIMILAALVLSIYGLVFLIYQDLASLLATGSGFAVAVYFLSLQIKRIGKKNTRQGSTLPLMVPLYVFFLLIPVFFAVMLIINGKFSFIMLVIMVSLSFTVYWSFLNVTLAVRQKYEENKALAKPLTRFPLISIIVPAYNEEKVIAGTLDTLLETCYPNKEIIVVDDGSKDRTYQIASTYARRGVKVIRRPNSGKAVAMNHGLCFAKGEIIVCVDADSVVSRTALMEIARSLMDSSVLAVASNVKVLNRQNPLLACQALEYIFDINIPRRGLDTFEAVTIVPGCLGAFRAAAVRNSGGWDIDTVVEDFDLTIKVSKAGALDAHRRFGANKLRPPAAKIVDQETKLSNGIRVSSAAVVYTEAPGSFTALWKQRMRWYYGTFQVLLKHRDAFSNKRFGALYGLSFPYIVISMVLYPVSNIVVPIAGIFAIMEGNMISLVITLCLFAALQFMIYALAIELDNEDRKLALFLPLFVGYKIMLDFIRLHALLNLLTNRRVEWNKAQRTGYYSNNSGSSMTVNPPSLRYRICST